MQSDQWSLQSVEGLQDKTLPTTNWSPYSFTPNLVILICFKGEILNGDMALRFGAPKGIVGFGFHKNRHKQTGKRREKGYPETSWVQVAFVYSNPFKTNLRLSLTVGFKNIVQTECLVFHTSTLYTKHLFNTTSPNHNQKLICFCFKNLHVMFNQSISPMYSFISVSPKNSTLPKK